LGVKITNGSAAAVQEKPTFESTEEAPAPVKAAPAKKQVKVTKPDIAIPPEFAEGDAPSGHWSIPLSEAPRDKPITVCCSYNADPNKFFYWRVMWVESPLGAGWHVCGTQWHKIDEEIVRGWTEDIGHP
jgi:hypothetical protein